MPEETQIATPAAELTPEQQELLLASRQELLDKLNAEYRETTLQFYEDLKTMEVEGCDASTLFGASISVPTEAAVQLLAQNIYMLISNNGIAPAGAPGLLLHIVELVGRAILSAGEVAGTRDEIREVLEPVLTKMGFSVSAKAAQDEAATPPEAREA